MELSAETFLEVVRSLRSDGTPKKMRRRKLPRVGVRLRLVILPCGPNSTGAAPRAVLVRLRDLSRRGVGFVHTERLEIGQAFFVNLPREAGGNLFLLGRIERCRQIDRDQFDIGGSIRLDVPREEVEQHVAGLRRSA